MCLRLWCATSELVELQGRLGLSSRRPPAKPKGLGIGFVKWPGTLSSMDLGAGFDAIQALQQPQDVETIQQLLRSMGAEEYEPRVVNMLMDFMYSYTADVLQDAETFSSEYMIASKRPGQVDMASVMLAVQSRAAFNFAQPPPQDMLKDMASQINAVELEAVHQKPGLPLPDKDQLTAPNYQYEPGAAK